ncbi:MAG: acyl-CoA dehydrogenase family protein [Rhodanobacter sp.]
MMNRKAWKEAGANGFLCVSVPEQHGGERGNFGHEAALL